MAKTQQTPGLDTLERPRTLKESALASLRAAITVGVFAPGERLVERVLCERLGVSRTVVRECIRHLESERLVSVIPNAGPSVAVLEASEVREIYEIRALLESAAIRSCARQATPETVAALKRHCQAIADALADGDVIAALGHTRRFYETIFVTGNKRVSWDLVERLNGQISRLRVLTLGSAGRATSGPANLRRIVAAIGRGDPDAAARACRDHIAAASRIALAQLEHIPIF